MEDAHETARRRRAGLAMATVSAAAFGSSGPMGRALIDAGWSSGAAVLLRLSGSAVLLGLVIVVLHRDRLPRTLEAWKVLAVYGTVAMAGVQLAFFNAVRTLDVGVALLLEYLAPVLLLAYTSLRSRSLPSRATLTGAGLTLVGLLLVLDVTGDATVDPIGVAWGLVAAVCLAGYFALSARQHEQLPPLVMAAGGTAVGAVVIGLAGLIGVVELTVTVSDTTLAGAEVPMLVPVVWLVGIATLTAYLTGIGGVRRLGARTASFVSLSEVLFAVLTAWLLLAQLPGLWQLLGGVAILVGIVVIQRNEGPAPANPRPDRDQLEIGRPVPPPDGGGVGGAIGGAG